MKSSDGLQRTSTCWGGFAAAVSTASSSAANGFLSEIGAFTVDLPALLLTMNFRSRTVEAVKSWVFDEEVEGVPLYPLIDEMLLPRVLIVKSSIEVSELSRAGSGLVQGF
jgi:hypothetical protein